MNKYGKITQFESGVIIRVYIVCIYKQAGVPQPSTNLIVIHTPSKQAQLQILKPLFPLFA